MKNQPTEPVSTRMKSLYKGSLVELMDMKSEIMSLTDLIAQAAIKNVNPTKDEISQRQAMDEFGVTLSWLKERESKGLLSRRRKGKCKNSPIMYSRHEILSLIEAERRACKTTRHDNDDVSRAFSGRVRLQRDSRI